MKDNNLASHLEQLSKILDELTVIHISPSDMPEIAAIIHDLESKMKKITALKELCSEQHNLLNDECYR